VVLRWADAMESRTEGLARLLTAKNGKPLVQSRGEISAGGFGRNRIALDLELGFHKSTAWERGLR